MKKLALLLVILILSALTLASITLTNPLTVTQGTVLETDPTAGASTLYVDFNNLAIHTEIQEGTVASGKIIPGALSPRVGMEIDLAACRWTSNNGLSGTIGAAACTNLNTTVKGWRNSIETFALTTGVVAGAQVPWP